MTRTRLTLTLLAAAMCGCAAKPQIKKPQVGDIAPGSFEVAWTVEAKATAPQAYYFVENTIFIYDKNNVVSAYDVNGGLKFRTTVGEPGDIVGAPMVQADRLVFPTSSALELYNPKGVKTKSIILPQPLRSPGVIVGDSVLCGSDSDTGGRLASINLTRSYNIYNWSILTGIINTKPVFFDNSLFCSTEDGRVFSVTLERGTPLWGPGPETADGIFRTDGKILGGIKADEGGVYVPSTDTKLYCLVPQTGRLKWQYYASVPLTTSPVITADTVYQYVEGQGIVALPKKATERLATAKWTYGPGKQLVSDDGKIAYVLTNSGAVAAVDKTSGKELFRTKRSDIVLAATNLDPKNPGIYAITKSGQLLGIQPVLTTGRVGELAMVTP